LSSDPARPKARIPDCPLARTAGVIGQWWTLEILHEVFDGHTRFESICRNLASPADVLLDRITELIAKGLLDTADFVFTRGPQASESIIARYPEIPRQR
jgi:DNA-binding HxlR family transcriptional regulator